MSSPREVTRIGVRAVPITSGYDSTMKTVAYYALHDRSLVRQNDSTTPADQDCRAPSRRSFDMADEESHSGEDQPPLAALDLHLVDMMPALVPFVESVVVARDQGLLDGVAVVEHDLAVVLGAAMRPPSVAAFAPGMDADSFGAGYGAAAAAWGEAWMASAILFSRLLDRVVAAEGVDGLVILQELLDNFPKIWTGADHG